MNTEESIERIKRKITIGECEKNIGIPVYISDLKTVLSELEKKDKVINEMAKYIIRNVSREKIERLTGLKDKEVIWSYDIKEYFTNKVEREGK